MAAIFIPPRIRVTDINGMPVPGALVTFYLVGTTTLKDIFQDSALTIPQSNPVQADSAGLLPVIYLSGAYKIRCTDADGVLLFPEVDNLDAPLSGSGGGTAEQARASLGVPAQDTFDALASQVGDIQAEINSYPAFGALAAKSKVAPEDLSNDFAPVCIQRQTTLITARSSLSSSIPRDNTTPLRSEGDTIFSVNFTPKRAGTTIRIRVVAQIAGDNRFGVLSLFNTIGATDPAIAAVSWHLDNAGAPQTCELEHEFTSAGTAQLTIQVNAGADGSYYLNGTNTAGMFNGAMRSRLIIEEYLAL